MDFSVQPLSEVGMCLPGVGGGRVVKHRDTHNPLALNVDQDFSSRISSAGIVLFFFQSVVKRNVQLEQCSWICTG